MGRIRTILGSLIGFVFGVKVEHPKVWIMQRLIFFIILTLLLIKPTANAIFLSKVGVDYLPIAYVMVAITALLFTYLYNRYINRLSSLKIFYNSIQLCALFLVVIGLILLTPWLNVFGAYLFYLFISIFGILSASQFWILANQIFDAREARKYFGIIGFGAIAGGIAGGYLASIISSILQSEVIPFVASITLLFVLFYIKQFSSSTVEKAEKPVIKGEVAIETTPFKLVIASKHLSAIALVIAVSVFTSKLIDFQFGFFASKAYPVEEDLTAFYGFMYSTFNLVAILIQVLLTTRVIGRFGIGYSLLILPLILVLNAGLLILIPGLVLVSSLKLMDASMKQSIYKAAIELIMLPVPKDLKLRTKTFLDVFVDSIATGISGLVLLLVIKAFDLPNWVITLIILSAAILWLYLTNKIRMEYLKVFRQSLIIKADEKQNTGRTIAESYENILTSGEEFQILKALTFLQNNPIPILEKTYLHLLNSSHPAILKSTIELLTYVKTDYSKDIAPFLSHENQNIQIAAFEYIINHQDKFDPNFLIDRINSTDPEIMITAIVAYAKEFKNDPRTLNILRIENRIQNVIDTLGSTPSKTIVSGILKTIGYGKFAALYPIIDKYLLSNDVFLRNQAIYAAGQTQTSHYLQRLLELSDVDEGEDVLVKAIAKYSEKQIELVIKNLIKKKSREKLVLMTGVLQRKPNQNSIFLLQSLVDSEDIELRERSIIALRVLSDNYPQLQINNSIINKTLIEECKYTNKILKVLSLYNSKDIVSNTLNMTEHPLISRLKEKIDSNLKIIFELLHIKYPPENYLEIYDYVKGADNELRNNAIEYVDNSLTHDLKTAIIPLLDYITTPESYLHIESNDEAKVKNFLLKNKDNEIRVAAKAFYGIS